MDNADYIPTYYEADGENCDSLQGFKVLRHDSLTASERTFFANTMEKDREMILAGRVCIADVTKVESSLHFDNRLEECKVMDGAKHGCTQQGKYVIKYSITPHQANEHHSVVSAFRTVYVKDTLPPVISLHFKTKLQNGDRSSQAYLIQQSYGGISQSDEPVTNPAADKRYNPYLIREHPDFKGDLKPDFPQLMAESTTSVNGWLIAAGVSAVAGMALLASSSKKTVTSVPV